MSKALKITALGALCGFAPRTLRVATSVALLGFLGACAMPMSGGVRTVQGDWRFYTPSQVHYVTGVGEVRTVIFGNAFDIPKATFDARVTDQMRGQPRWATPARYATEPSEAAREAFHVALAFDPPVSYDGDDACAARFTGEAATSGAAPGGTVRLVAAFCSSVHTLSQVTAAADGVHGPDDRAFAQLIDQVMFDLFPARDPNVGASVPRNN